MSSIDIFFIDYSNESRINRAIDSLAYLKHHIGKVTIFHYRKIHVSTPLTLNSRVIVMTDIGEQINQLVNSTSDYIMFMYSDEILTTEIYHSSLSYKEKKFIMTSQITVRNLSIKRPFIVSASLLKKYPLLSSKFVPFNEACFVAWLLNQNLQASSHYEGVRQLRKKIDTANMHKWKYLEKFTLKTKKIDTPISLSVMMSTYNMEKYIETALLSCLLQHEPFQHIYVIDDGSTDRTHDILAKWSTERDNITFLHKENGGKARALNSILPKINSDFILEVDGDDWLDPDAVTTLLNLLLSLPNDVSVLYGNLKIWKEVTPSLIKYKKSRIGKQIDSHTELFTYPHPLGPRIYRTDKLKGIGGFPVISFEDGRLYEDVSVLYNLLKTGRILYKDFSVYNVRQHDESITKKNQSKWNDFIVYLTTSPL
ncbi:glycosyltransferase family 2 protein [Metabacillus niabensis]|uniref:Glycosyltransferase 2-like domain-containing protein n=2 Tax=Metabacillus niabensis TaxID=324854 RepID=A0ABT9Z7K6_9BACI|nr:glycosyltransferase family A protein [Metabacillus niabensis]MDQ0227985.1 hypothetical protein [Metabacillus niabensis]